MDMKRQRTVEAAVEAEAAAGEAARRRETERGRER